MLNSVKTTLQRSSTDGKKLADETNQMLDELLPEIEKTQNLVQNISASSKEQATGAEQINAITSFNKMPSPHQTYPFPQMNSHKLCPIRPGEAV